MEDWDEPDVLWEFFMNHITFGENWQFFTPTHLCDMMASMTLWANTKPWQSVYDPACWSGRTLLSALKLQPKIIVTACDLDRRCTKMAAINLFLRGATGRAICMNSLSLEIYWGYEFRIWWWSVPQIFELEKDDITFTETQKEQIKQATEEKKIGGLFDF